MSLMVYSLAPALMLLLFGGLLATLYQLAYRPDEKVEAASVAGGRVALGVFFLWMCLLSIQQQQLPIASFGQLAVFLAFLIWAGHTYVQSRIPQRLLALFPIGVAVVLILIGAVVGIETAVIPEKIRGFHTAWHISFSLAGIAMILGAGVYGSGTLILHHQLDRRTFNRFFSGLPPLDDMNRLRRTALYAGWILISVSLAAALLRMFLKTDSSAVMSHLHPMLTLWVIVSALALTERRRWLAQHRLAALSVILAVVVLALLVVSVVEIFVGAWL